MRFFLSIFFWAFLTYGEQQTPVLEDLTADLYTVVWEKTSATQAVVLLRVLGTGVPPKGALLLIREDSENQVALRVLKRYPDRNQFAAKVLKKYPDWSGFKGSRRYFAIEKSGSILFGKKPEEFKENDEKTLDSSEKTKNSLDSWGPQENDSELDLQEEKTLEEKDDDLDVGTQESEDFKITEDDEFGLLHVVETKEFDSDFHWLGVGFASLTNYNFDDTLTSFVGAGIRYGFSPLRRILLRSPNVQDLITAEVAGFFYTVVGYDPTLVDSYSVVPVLMSGRYSIYFSESLAFFINIGLMQNFVFSAKEATDASLLRLGSTLPVYGGGFLWQIGPRWFLRGDIGFDQVGLGVAIRF